MSTLLHPAHIANDDQILSNWHVVGSSDEPDWLQRIRKRGHSTFLDSGLPTRKHRDWKYTDLSSLKSIKFTSASTLPAKVPSTLIDGVFAEDPSVPRLVFVNGFLEPELSSAISESPQLTLGSISAALHSNLHHVQDNLAHRAVLECGPMVALNTALFRDGASLNVSAGVDGGWVEVVYISGGADCPIISSPRNVFVLGENARLGIIEHHISISGERYVANSVTDIQVQPGAQLRHYIIVDSGERAVNIATTRVVVARDATYEAFNLVLGGGVTRNEMQVRLGDCGASASLSGAYVVGGEEHCDNTTYVEHAAPKTRSCQVFKGAIGGKGRGVFQGRVVVARGANQADGQQLSKALLLSATAEIDQQPALEIFADDVKCSHGAASGHIDEGELFYLRSRGVPEPLARKLLIEGFLAEAVNEITDAQVRGVIATRLAQALLRVE